MTQREPYRFIISFLPILLFALIYDSMRYYPNYLFGEIDTRGVYELEKQLFGFVADGVRVTPGEYFHVHHWAVTDILSGIFYLCWVPLPVFYGLWLYLTGHKDLCLRLTSCFLFVNLIGFAGYYIHPAAPPWYVMQHGFDPILNTPGDVAGFENFDRILGINLFHSIYCKNANVFAAIPSMHSAYCPVALYYALQLKHNRPWQTILTVVSFGIWFSAVYSAHHYIIDVLLGILTAIIGIALFEYNYRKFIMHNA